MFTDPNIGFGEEIPYTEVPAYEPSAQEKAYYWEIGIGLQATDRLTPSQYLRVVADEHISGESSYHEVLQKLSQYHSKTQTADRQAEADFSATKISQLLSLRSFALSVPTLIAFHAQIFKDIVGFTHPVGELRTAHIIKPEEVLDYHSVDYTPPEFIQHSLDYLFAQEQKKDYRQLVTADRVASIQRFISDVWAVHPFREGNTRTIAAFTIAYLGSLGSVASNEPFYHHARYFRDALVLANAPYGMRNNAFLSKFMANVFLGGAHRLNRAEMLAVESSADANRNRSHVSVKFLGRFQYLQEIRG